ncbi:MAG: hypothetical protein CMO55_16675 [Verrucomicrobiales bacterium]|nr:hypothetical protein [Verrucomicrobiales bacterium]
MSRQTHALLAALVLPVSLSFAQSGGLDQAEPIGAYLDGNLPSETPRPATGSWTLVNAFPNLTFIDPVQMIPVPGTNELLVVEKNGRLAVFENDPATTSKTVLFNISSNVESSHDSGMVGAAFHPEFGQVDSPNRDYIFVYYRYTPNPAEKNRAYCRLSRFTWRHGTNSIDTSSEFVLINQYDRHNWHNGGGLFFGPDGFLYLSIGDEGGANDQYNTGQKINVGLLAGILRIDVDQDPTRSHPIRRQPQNPSNPPFGWPNSYSQGYYIPNDNPWQSANGSNLEEFWAIGSRSPHRMTQDPVTGRIWLGDVGQGSREEISLVVKGANLQWPYREGDISGPKSKPSNLIGTDQPPVWAYGRGLGGCVIGGYVYRGSEHPDLYGKYIMGDHNNNKIRALTYTPGEAPQIEDLVTMTRTGPGPKNGLGSFGIDADNEVYILSLAGTDKDGGVIYKFGRTGSGIPEPPSTLSATGAFSDLASLTPRSGVMPYDLVQPLWSDGADKKRWIAIPNDGTPDTAAEKIQFSENEPWTFPIGTVLIKHFEISGRRLETRFFVHGSDGKYFGFTYKWRPDNSDADLLPGPPVEETIDLGGGESVEWHFPGRTECFICHTDAAKTVLGPKTRHLNREIFYPTTGRAANQLLTLSELGFFDTTLAPPAISTFLTSANVNDTTESLDRRARAYLDINCSQCHRPNGPTQAQFDARLTVPPNFQNIINVEPTNPLTLADPKLVEPDNVLNSILHIRMSSLDGCCAMPPLAKNAIDTDAVNTVAEWIRSLDPAISPTGPTSETPPVDYSLPAITLTHTNGSQTVDGTFDVTATVSEPILGLTASDFDVVNGTVDSISGSGSNWTITISPTANGLGNLTIAADKVTDTNGNANLAIENPLVFEADLEATPINLLTNASFENGLQSWDSGGSAATTSQAQSGAIAVTVGTDTFIVQSIPATGSENYTFTGWYTGDASFNKLYAGTTFFDSNGNEVGDEFVLLPPATAYTSFSLEMTAPPNASVAAVYILTSGSGMAKIDNLVFYVGGQGDPGNSDNLFPNGDFENDFTSWDAVNDTTIVAGANTGNKAARMGDNSFIVFNTAATPGDVLDFSGVYKTEGSSSLLEAGFTFWDANGNDVGDAITPLSNSASYQNFQVLTEVPANTTNMSVWIFCGSGGAITADSLSLTRSTAPPPEPDNLLSNGGFESGDFSGWDTGGSNIAVTTDARTGTGAAEFGINSFVVHNQSASGGNEYRLHGYYKTSAPGGIHEAGFIFWGSGGTILSETQTTMPNSTGYSEFEVIGIAPSGTVSLSAWIYNGTGSMLIVDDVTLEVISSTAVKTLTTKVESKMSDLGMATLKMRSILLNRDPNSYRNAIMNQVQPDLFITHRSSNWSGINIYNRSGANQLARSKTRRKRINDKFDIAWQNDAFARYDGGKVYGTGSDRNFKLKYFELSPHRRNLTALIQTGRFQSPRIEPGATVRYQVKIKQKGKSRKSSFRGRLTTQSTLDESKIDAVQFKTRRK